MKSRSQYMKQYRAQKKSEETESTKVLAQIEKTYRDNRALITEAMKTLKIGTKVYLDYANSLDKLDRNHRDELVRRGLVAENLGVNIRPRWEFIALIGRTGEITCIEVKDGQEPPKQPDPPQRTAEELRGIAALDEEYR